MADPKAPKVINPPVPLDWKWLNPQEQLRKFGLVINEILAGKMNNTLEITLWPSETSTEIALHRITADTVPQFVPRTASASAAVTGTLYFKSEKGKLTIYHDSDPAEDRTFGVVLVG